MPRQERREQIDPLDELERGAAGVEAQPQDDAEAELDQRRAERDAARGASTRILAAGPEQDRRRAEDRQEDDQRQQRHRHPANIRGANHVAAAATPTSIISA